MPTRQSQQKQRAKHSKATHLPNILQKIIARKKEEVAAAKLVQSLASLSQQAQDSVPTRGFIQALRAKNAQQYPAVIAEIKKASPSKGILRADFDPVVIAQRYLNAGAACLSILTDRDFFQGHDDYLIAVKHSCPLPILRKDFIIDPYQIIEARVLGADCILLIAACLSPAQLQEYYALGQALGLDVLIEVHDQTELNQALALNPPMIGINNRDLRTFQVSLETTLACLPHIPKDVLVVTESGISQPEHVYMMQEYSVNAFLVGEVFMRASDPGQALKTLFFD